MISRFLHSFKNKLAISFITLLLTVSVLYFYINHLQEKNSIHTSGERCISELTSLKYQLYQVTEYKNKIDKLLTEAQMAHKSDKEKFKDIMESCIAMKQQASICQSQFEDLQSECKRVRDDFNQYKKRLNV